MELKTYFAQDRNGNLIPSANVSIYLTGTTTLASGLTTVSGTPLVNPFTADADGKIQFRAPDGIYDMQVSLGGTTGVKVTFQCVDVEQQLSDATSAADRAEAAAESIEGQAATITTNTREQWRRTLADAGINLVAGSFEEGATVSTTTDAVWHKTGGQCYTWGGTLPKTVPISSTPGSTGGIASGAWASVSTHSLRTDLGNTGGVKIVNGAQGYLDTVTSATSSQLKDGALYTFKGRSSAYDGGGGLFRYDAESTETADGGVVFAVTGGGRLIRQVRTTLSENQIGEAINVRWFGAKGDAATDDTAAILAAYNFGVSSSLFFTLLFPMGRYLTLTSFVFNDVTNCSFLMEGATFIGGSNGADNSQLAVFEVRNAVAGSISGPWFITTKPQSGPIVNNPNAYQAGFLARGVPGGVLKPDAGVAAFFSVSDLSTIRIGKGIQVGEINNDAQTSEMQFVNCKTPSTVNPVHVAGSQTLVSFVGCTLASNSVAGITNAVESAIINDGGCVIVQGGSVEQHANSETQMILMGPCYSTLYGNPYGQVHISGAVIETIAPICNIANRYGYTTPASYLSSLTIEGCTGGYLGAMPADVAPVNVYDTEYAGVISIHDGSMFYATPSSPTRTGYNVNASGNSKVRIAVGKTVFDTATGFKSWQAGVAGGVMIHPEILATAANVTSQTIPENTVTIVVWGNNPTDNVRMGRYQYMLNTSTGVMVVPDAGIKTLRIEAAVPLSSGSIDGNIMLYRNGSLYEYGVVGGGVGIMNITVPDPVAGDQFDVRLHLSAPSTLNSLAKLRVFLTT